MLFRPYGQAVERLKKEITYLDDPAEVERIKKMPPFPMPGMP